MIINRQQAMRQLDTSLTTLPVSAFGPLGLTAPWIQMASSIKYLHLIFYTDLMVRFSFRFSLKLNILGNCETQRKHKLMFKRTNLKK